uniref:Uncharacterized protein n=1 Tax=Anguilla anguilla TaxID=7936 RepID=A0A0E9WYD7_ANGAN
MLILIIHLGLYMFKRVHIVIEFPFNVSYYLCRPVRYYLSTKVFFNHNNYCAIQCVLSV